MHLESTIGSFPQLDAIQNKKGFANCNVDSKNNNRFHSGNGNPGFLFLAILAIAYVNVTMVTNNAEIFKTGDG